MKVLLIAHYFPKPDNPVMGTWALTQAQALVRQGIELQVVSYTSWLPTWLARTPGAKAYAHCPAQHLWLGNVSVRYPRWLYYPVPPLKQLAYANPVLYLRVAAQSAQAHLQVVLDSYKPDLIFCHHSLPNGWVLRQVAAQHHLPLIVQEHDFDEIRDCYRYPARRLAMQTVAQSVQALLAVSEPMARDMRALFPNAPVLTHHNGVNLPDPSLFQTPRPSELHQKKVILVCGLFAERKGVPLLVEAFHRIAAKHPDAILRIVGDGPEKMKIKKTIDRLNLHQSVQMMGRKPHAAVLQEMAWADCFALVGWDEPFATVFLEAMAAGKPILCCNDGGINDVIQDGVQGYTVPPKDLAATARALDRLLRQDEQRLAMGRQGRQLIEQRLSWDVQATNLVHLFEQTLTQPHRARIVV
jgi:glycosyltransferase involved in cell wall biosynthesis